jgi:hypothetical protein
MEILIGIIVVIGVIMYLNGNSNKEKSQKLYTAYRQALASKNKAAALEAGRAYYAFKRKDGRLTIYDEQAITNDLTAYTQPDSPAPSY